MAQNVGIQEDRTYTCIQLDKSTSLTDLTPQNLLNTAYWTPMKYSVGEYVLVNDDSLIDGDINNTSDIIVTPLYKKGVYQCIAEDFDIKLAKVTTFATQPTTPDATAKTPLCFDKYADITLSDGTKQRVAVWSQKWNRVADLPQ